MHVKSLGILSLISLLGLLSIGLIQSSCQTVSEPSQAGPNMSNTVPLSHLYWHFLTYQHHLDEVAANQEKEGRSGAAARSMMQAKLSMSDEHFEPVHRASDRLHASMANLNARAEHLRSVYVSLNPPKDGPLTPQQQSVHDQLKKMNEEREELLTEQMNRLDNELAPNDRTVFQEFVRKQIALSVVAVVPPKTSVSSSVANSPAGGGK
jgi:hypothetical protein